MIHNYYKPLTSEEKNEIIEYSKSLLDPDDWAELFFPGDDNSIIINPDIKKEI